MPILELLDLLPAFPPAPHCGTVSQLFQVVDFSLELYEVPAYAVLEVL